MAKNSKNPIGYERKAEEAEDMANEQESKKHTTDEYIGEIYRMMYRLLQDHPEVHKISVTCDNNSNFDVKIKY